MTVTCSACGRTLDCSDANAVAGPGGSAWYCRNGCTR